MQSHAMKSSGGCLINPGCRVARSLACSTTGRRPCDEIRRCCATRRARLPAPRCSTQSSESTDSSDMWRDLAAYRRQMREAVDEQDFQKASELRDKCDMIADKLPAVRQYTLHQLDILQSSSSTSEKAKAIHALGEVGDESAVEGLTEQLHEEHLQLPAQVALWKIFERCPCNPHANELMEQGKRLLQSSVLLGDALETFNQIVLMEPQWAEAYNKRATALYMLGRFEESIQDCHRTLSRQPLHFGALSGLGICLLGLDRHREALDAFKGAIAIHPGLDSVRKQISTLADLLDSADVNADAADAADA